MFCTHCGQNLPKPSNISFCPKCGHKIVLLEDNGRNEDEITGIDSFVRTPQNNEHNVVKPLRKHRKNNNAKRFSKKAVVIVVSAVVVIIAVALSISYFIPRFRYSSAIRLASEGCHTEAAEIFDSLGDFRDSHIQAENQALLALSVGDVKEMGGFYWRVLDIQDERALLVSENIIDSMEFSHEWGNFWSDSLVRQYLNYSFYYSLPHNIRERIAEVVHSNHTPGFQGTGSYTRDNIFILGIEEVVRFFGNSGQIANVSYGADEILISDQYNHNRTAYDMAGHYSGWWLRSRGSLMSPCFVNYDGVIRQYGWYSSIKGVRPALWLYLSAPNINIPNESQDVTAIPLEIREYTISACNTHSMAITNDGVLWAWGGNRYGRLGDGTTTNRYTPVWIMENVAAVSTSRTHTMAITNDGSLWIWGSNASGQLGDNTNENRSTPIRVMNDVIAVAAGDGHSAAITSDGGLWTWGANWGGQLGNGTTENQRVPIRVMDDVVAVSVGMASSLAVHYGVTSGAYTLAITSDGVLWSWGSNAHGQLGDGTTTNRHSPVRIMDNVVSVSAGGGHTMAITSDNVLWGWGRNTHHGVDFARGAFIDRAGQLGDGSNIEQHSPVRIMDNVISVSAGGEHTIAITSDGTLWGWGSNHNVQLGGATSRSNADRSRHIPERVKDTSVLAASAGNNHIMAITGDGSLWILGGNHDGLWGTGASAFNFGIVWVMDNLMLPSS